MQTFCFQKRLHITQISYPYKSNKSLYQFFAIIGDLLIYFLIVNVYMKRFYYYYSIIACLHHLYLVANIIECEIILP